MLRTLRFTFSTVHFALDTAADENRRIDPGLYPRVNAEGLCQSRNRAGAVGVDTRVRGGDLRGAASRHAGALKDAELLRRSVSASPPDNERQQAHSAAE